MINEIMQNQTTIFLNMEPKDFLIFRRKNNVGVRDLLIHKNFKISLDGDFFEFRYSFKFEAKHSTFVNFIENLIAKKLVDYLSIRV